MIARLHEIDRKLADLAALRQEIAALVASCEGGTIDECRILEALAPQGPETGSRGISRRQMFLELREHVLEHYARIDGCVDAHGTASHRWGEATVISNTWSRSRPMLARWRIELKRRLQRGQGDERTVAQDHGFRDVVPETRWAIALHFKDAIDLLKKILPERPGRL